MRVGEPALPVAAELANNDMWLKREKALADAGGAALTPQPVDALPADLCGANGTAKDECVRTVPPRENGGNLDTKETVVGTTLLFPCFIDGCGLFAGDVHYAQGGGEVCGTAIEMGAKVTMQARIMPGMASLMSTMHFEGGPQLKRLAPRELLCCLGTAAEAGGRATGCSPPIWAVRRSHRLPTCLRTSASRRATPRLT